MINFKILKKSKISRARIGFLETPHGVVETPSFVPVATQGVIKTLDSEETRETKSQILISNTFWLHLRPGEKIIEKEGDLHKFMNWKKPLMTDSGGYQVFSLGFGQDFALQSKILGKKSNRLEIIKEGLQPKKIKIEKDGVIFYSPIDGRKLFLGPKESIKIQEKLGADIIFCFDECIPPGASYKYVKESLERVHRWARICLKTKSTKQALFGIIQGSYFKDLRIASAKFINSLPFDGYGIGGEFGVNKKAMTKMLNWIIDELTEKKPRHLLGIGSLEDIELIIKSGIDLFDCIIPTHYARHGIAFTSEGKLDMRKKEFLKKKEPLDKDCVCKVCLNYKKSYISHLLRAQELTAFKLLTFHNLYYFNNYVEQIRQKIKKGLI